MSTNHKDIGTLYLLFGLSFGLVGSALSAILRLELNTQGHSIMDGHGYNVVVTGHGLIMIFFFCHAYVNRWFWQLADTFDGGYT